MRTTAFPGLIASNLLAWTHILHAAFSLAMPVLPIACLRHTSRGEGNV